MLLTHDQERGVSLLFEPGCAKMIKLIVISISLDNFIMITLSLIYLDNFNFTARLKGAMLRLRELLGVIHLFPSGH